MGVRETFSRHPRITCAAAAALILAAGVAIAMQADIVRMPGRGTQAYYTADDGKTYFVGSVDLGSPVTLKGQTAYRCFVFQCDGKQFVAYLVRYPDGAAPEAPSHPQPQPRPAVPPMPGEEPAAAAAPMAGNKPSPAGQSGYELKRPGDTQWVRSGDMIATAKLTRPRCAGGAGGTGGAGAEPVLP